MSKNKLTSDIKDKFGNEWSISSSSVYESIIENAPLYKKLNPDTHYDAVANIAGQLQLLEFTELLLSSYEFIHEGEMEILSFLGGGTMEIHNEIEHTLYKQAVIAIASVTETLCYLLLKSSNVELPNHSNFIDYIKTAEKNDLIDAFDAGLLHQLRKLRNSLHLHSDSYDLATFNNDNYIVAKSCLYWLLLRLLMIDVKVMSIHFPFLPKQDKEDLYFEV